MRIAPSVLSILALSLAVGCSSQKGEAILQTFEPVDGPLPDNFWAGAAATNRDDAHRTSLWPLPLVLDLKKVQLDQEKERVRYLSLSGVNPGLTILPTLPFYVTVDYGRWSKSGAIERRGLTWTPLWAWDYAEGESPVTLEAGGFPLIWGYAVVDAPEDGISLDIDHFLLTLGPLHADLSMGREDKKADGWVFFPAYAASLGGLLWTSYSFESSDGYEVAHGPLAGYLGYKRSEGLTTEALADLFSFLDTGRITDAFLQEEEVETGPAPADPLRPSSMLLLGGTLWYSQAEKNSAGEELFGRHGPLWGMFGYGKKNGRDTLLLLWIPIPI